MACGLGCLAVVLLGATSAEAETIGLVVHAREHAPSSRSEVRAAVAEAARDIGLDMEVRPIARAEEQIAAGAVPLARMSQFAAVDRLAADGWRSYLEARPTTAVARLGQARAAAVELIDLPGAIEVYADLSVRMGAALLEVDRTSDARRAFRLAAILAPARQVTDAEFKPRVVEHYAQARLGGEPAHRRQLISEPAGASIEVDGVLLGQAPLDVDIEQGDHLIVMRAPGHRPRGSAVHIAEGTEPVIAVDLEPDPHRQAVARARTELAIGAGENTATRAAAAVLFYSEADELLLVASVLRRGAPALLGQACAGVPILCGRVVEIGYPDARGLAGAARTVLEQARSSSRRFPVTLLADARLIRDGGPSQQPVVATGAGDRPLWRNPWLWVGAGSVALAITAGIIATRDREVQPIVVGNPCDFGGC